MCIRVCVCVCAWVCLQTILFSAWNSNLFWFCLVSRTRNQLGFKGQIRAKWAARSYRANWFNKTLFLHRWMSDTGYHALLSVHFSLGSGCNSAKAGIFFPLQWFPVSRNRRASSRNGRKHGSVKGMSVTNTCLSKKIDIAAVNDYQ